jgi:HD-like signal output (HDOD) protein
MSYSEQPTTRSEADRKGMTSDDIVAKLKKSLTSSGDFPTSAKIVTELRALAMNPATTANQLAEVILREPSLGMRVLALVNSAFYRPTKPITTISQAVIQIGMKPLIEMCSGLVLLQRFVPEARKNGSFALCLRRSVMTSLISSSLTSGSMTTASKALAQRHTESGYLVGMIAEMGTLLLAFYYPNLYDSAVRRAQEKNQPIAVSIKQIFGLSPLQLSVEIIGSLGLPQYYADCLRRTEEIANDIPNATATANEDLTILGRCLGCASATADIINTANDSESVGDALNAVREKFKISSALLQSSMQSLAEGLKNHCDAIQLTLPDLSVDLTSLPTSDRVATPSAPQRAPAATTSAAAPAQQSRPDTENISDELGDFKQYVQDIKDALRNNEPTATIITTTMEACSYCLSFGRVVLLLANRDRTLLVGRMALGQVPGFMPGKFSRAISDPAISGSPDYQAFIVGQPVTTGTPLFKDAHTVAAIPIGSGRRTVGVVYCERGGAAAQGLSMQEHSAVILLASLLDKAVQRVG